MSAGFGTWEDVMDINERDMEKIGMKLGHRRKLQREIASSNGYPSDVPLESNQAVVS